MRSTPFQQFRSSLSSRSLWYLWGNVHSADLAYFVLWSKGVYWNIQHINTEVLLIKVLNFFLLLWKIKQFSSGLLGSLRWLSLEQQATVTIIDLGIEMASNQCLIFHHQIKEIDHLATTIPFVSSFWYTLQYTTWCKPYKSLRSVSFCYRKKLTVIQAHLKINVLSRKRSIFFVTHLRKWNPYII